MSKSKFTANFSTGLCQERTSDAQYTHAWLVRAEASRNRSTCHKGSIMWKTGFATSEARAERAANSFIARCKSLGHDILVTREVVMAVNQTANEDLMRAAAEAKRANDANMESEDLWPLYEVFDRATDQTVRTFRSRTAKAAEFHVYNNLKLDRKQYGLRIPGALDVPGL